MGKGASCVFVVHLPYKSCRFVEANKDDEGLFFVAKQDGGTIGRRPDDLFDFDFMETHGRAPSVSTEARSAPDLKLTLFDLPRL